MRHPTVGARHARRGRPRRRRGTDADPEFRPHFHCRLSVKRPRRHDRRRRRSRSISARVRTHPPRPGTEKRTITIPPRSLPLALTVPVSSLAGYNSRGHAVYRAKHLSPPKRSSLQVRSPTSPRAPPPLHGPAPSRPDFRSRRIPSPRAQDWDEWGAFENEVASAVTSVASSVTNMVGGGGNRGGQPRRSPAGRAPTRDPQVSRGATDSTPRNAPARIVFFTLPPAVADRTSPDLSRPVTRRAQPPCRTS